MAECVEDQVNVITKKDNGAVAIEIASHDRPTKLKPLPAALLSRMMHTTNTNKFEFMKNPEAKTGSAASSTRTGSRATSFAGSLGRTRPGTGQSQVSMGSMGSFVGTGASYTATIRAAAREAARAAEADESLSERVETVVRNQTNVLDLRPDGDSATPGLTDESSSSNHGESPKVQETQVTEPIVQPDMENIEEKENGAVVFDVVFSPQARNAPRQDLAKRLSKRPPGGPKRKKQQKEQAADDNGDEGDAEGETTPESREDAIPRSRTARFAKTRARRVFGEGCRPPAQGDDGELGICETPVCATPSQRRGEAIGIGVGIEDRAKIEDMPEPEHLSEQDRELCSSWVKFLGLATVKALLSKLVQHRMEGMKKVRHWMSKFKQARPDFRTKLFEVFAAIVQQKLMENVMQVYQLTADITKELLEFGHDVAPEAMHQVMDMLIPVLLKRAGDGNQRICGAAEEVIQWIASREDVKGLHHISRFITQPVPDATKAFKHVVARFRVISGLINAYGFQQARDEGLSAESVNHFTLDVIETVNRRVCQDAAKMVQLIYEKLGLKAIHLLNVQVKDNASEEYLQRALGPLIQSLMRQLGGAEGRQKAQQASDSLLALAMHEKVGSAFIGKHVQQPPEDLYDVQALTSRLEIVTRMVSNIGFTTNCLSVENVMLYAVTGIQSEFAPVRQAAGDLVIAAHKKVGEEVWQYLVVGEENEYFTSLKKRVIAQAKSSIKGGSSIKARLKADVGMGRAQDRTVAFSGVSSPRR
mmetsp:Transcript_153154/g.267601  ORF Transcript_153154/g.267601 Transcript_153154/m.267601 type:complete len:760 (-) Transcript_153154:147-2426(-)